MTEFREYMVGWVLREIDDEFTSAGITASQTTNVPVKSGARRLQIELYYASLDVAKPDDARKLLNVFENILVMAYKNYPGTAEELEGWLLKDGYTFENNRLRSRGIGTSKHLTASLAVIDAQTVHDNITRMEDAIDDDPALAIGSAKELIESVCKTILEAKGEPVPESDLSVLVKATTKALKLAPDDIPDSSKGAKLIKTTLHSLAGIVGCIGELRSLYGTGHGKSGSTRGLQPRHARLVVGASSTLVTFLWDTYSHHESQS
jgi:hypothetical protein